MKCKGGEKMGLNNYQEEQDDALKEDSNQENIEIEQAEPEATEPEVLQTSKQPPEFRILQQEFDRKEGKTVLKEVGVAWKNVSQNGKEFYIIKIGNLRLFMFKNEKK
jgi:hypothetical protein